MSHFHRFSIPAAFILSVAASHAADKITFDDHIFPIFESYCLECHNQDEAKGGLDLSNYGATMAGGSGGEILNPGRPDESKVYLVTAKIEEEYMPPKGQGLNKTELESLKNWIAGGVLENETSTPKKAKETKLTMTVDPASLGKPDGPPPMPEHLLLEPVVVTDRAAAASAVTTSPWAPVAAVAGQKQILLYNTDNQRLIGILPYAEGHVESLHFSRNGSLLLAGGGAPGKNGRVVAFDLKTGERKLELGREFDTILSSDITADHAYVAFGGPSKLIKILLTSNGEEISAIKKHTDWVTAVRFSPDGILLATGDRQGNLYVWESQSGNLFHDLRGHKKAITSLEWRADSNVLASSSEDGQVILWEMKEGKEVKKWAAHPAGVLDLDFHRDTTLATTGRDRRVKLWDQAGKMLAQSGDLPNEPLLVRFNNDGKKLIIGDWTGGIATWGRDLKAKSGQLQANPPSIATRLSQSATQLASVEKQLVAAETTAAELEKQANAAAQSRNQIAQQLNQKRAEVKKLDNQLKAHQTAKTPPPAELPLQIEAAKKAEAGIVAMLGAADKAIPEKNKARDEAKKTVPAIESQIVAAKSYQRYWQAAQANLQHHRLADSLAPLQESAKTEETKFKAAQDAHTQTTAALKAAREEVEKATQQLEARKKELLTTTASLPRQEKDIRTTRLVLSQQQHAEKLLREQLARPADELGKIALQLKDAQAKATNSVAASKKALEDQVAHLRNCVPRAEDAIGASTNALADAKTKVSKLEATEKNTATAFAAAKSSRDKAINAVSAKQKELDTLKQRYLALSK